VRPPQPPVFLFVIDVSYPAVSSGMLRCVAATLQHTISRLPGGERTQVGVITFDAKMHFYNLSGATPQMMVVSEIDETFLPMPEDLLVNLTERKECLLQLFEKLPSMFSQTQSTDLALGPTLKAAYQVASHVGGKIQLFCASRASVGEGKLRNRDAPAGKQGKEAASTNLLQPDTDFYKTLAVDCSKQQLCVDVWSCSSAYADLATLGQLAKHTGGAVMHYPGFTDGTHGEQLSRDLQHNLTREQGLEAVMRVRASRGLRISAFYGHFFIRGVDLLALPNVDEDKSFAIEMAHEESALSAATACVQAALLYTTTSGERRIRVLTMELPVTSQLSTMFDSADVDACISLMARVAAEAALNAKLLDGAEKLQNTCMELLRAYRALCPPHAKSTTSQLLLPESLQLLPLYTLALMKSSVFSAGPEVRADERSNLFYLLSTMPVFRATSFIHPKLIRIDPPEPGARADAPPALLPLTATVLQTDGVYLLNDGANLTLWLGSHTRSEYLQAVFGWPTLENVDPAALRLLPPTSSAEAARLHSLVEAARGATEWAWMPLVIAKQGHGDAPFQRALVEDQTKQMMSYSEYLVHCHRYILSTVS